MEEKNLKLLYLIMKANRDSREFDKNNPQRSNMYWMNQKEHICNFVLARLKKHDLLNCENCINGKYLKQRGAIDWIKVQEIYTSFDQITNKINVQFTEEESFEMLIYLIHYLSIQQNLVNGKDIDLANEMISNYEELLKDKIIKLRKEDFRKVEGFINIIKEYFWENSNLDIMENILKFLSKVNEYLN